MILTILGGPRVPRAARPGNGPTLSRGDHAVLVNGQIEHWGTTVTRNPWGPEVLHNGQMVATPGPIAFGGYFFGITGFHGFTYSAGGDQYRDVYQNQTRTF